jgi:thiol-disulfide isomerase/thioredoxin
MLTADVRVRAWSHVVNAQLEMPVVLELGLGRLFHLEQGFDEPAATAAGADVLDAVRAGEAAELAAVPGKWTVFDFWAEWCEACKGLDARLRGLAARRPDLAVRRVNIVDFESPIARRELPGIELLPHLRLVRPGGGVAWEASGPADELFAEIEKRTRGD